MSLTAKGTPARAPKDSPFDILASMFLACARASSGMVVIKLLILLRANSFRYCSTTDVALSSPLTILLVNSRMVSINIWLLAIGKNFRHSNQIFPLPRRQFNEFVSLRPHFDLIRPQLR